MAASSFIGAPAAPTARLWILAGRAGRPRYLGELWEDPQAEAHVKSLNDGNAVVPTVDTGDTHFVVADLVSRNKVKKLIQNTLDAGGEA